ncbi:MAG: ABC transporter substrate-binding protein [Acidimicrobiales bacterium]|jgi:sn-glycerol 3-phosphate transport system substrate-binding protein
MRAHRSRPVALILPLGALTLLLAGCSSSSGSSSTTAASTTSSTACSPAALDGASAPVTVSFWESMPRANGQTLQALTNAFNASQSRVHVDLVVQTSYDDTWQKYQAGLNDGELPDVVQLQDTDTQGAIDTQSIQPVQNCMEGFHYSVGDLLPRALAYWKVDGIQQAMPFAVSGPVLYYNKLAFQKAGLDPDRPPATLAQLVTDAKILKDAGQGGMGLKLDPWYVETELATTDQLFVNNDNGRTARATQAVFDTPTGVQIFSDLDQLVSSGDADTNSANGADAYDNLLGVGSGKYAMTVDTSAALGTIEQLLSQYPNVQLGVAHLPTLQATPTGGVEPGGSALWISKRASPAEQAASWEYVAFLDSTASQATWSAGTGYIPLRTSSAESPTIQNLWATNPQFEVAYTQLTSGIESAATAGAVLGPYDDVRTAVVDAEESMFTNGVSPTTALARAKAATDTLITNYNQRIGPG